MGIFRREKEPELSSTAIELATIAQERLGAAAANGHIDMTTEVDAILEDLTAEARRELFRKKFEALTPGEQLAFLAERFDDAEIQSALEIHQQLAKEKSQAQASMERLIYDAGTRFEVKAADIPPRSRIGFELYTREKYDEADDFEELTSKSPDLTVELTRGEDGGFYFLGISSPDYAIDDFSPSYRYSKAVQTSEAFHYGHPLHTGDPKADILTAFQFTDPEYDYETLVIGAIVVNGVDLLPAAS